MDLVVIKYGFSFYFCHEQTFVGKIEGWKSIFFKTSLDFEPKIDIFQNLKKLCTTL
jgi:hypothetical protein